MAYSTALLVLDGSRNSCHKASCGRPARVNDLQGSRRLWLELLESRVPPSSLLIGGLLGLELLGEALTQPAAANQSALSESFGVEPRALRLATSASLDPFAESAWESSALAPFTSDTDSEVVSERRGAVIETAAPTPCHLPISFLLGWMALRG